MTPTDDGGRRRPGRCVPRPRLDRLPQRAWRQRATRGARVGGRRRTRLPPGPPGPTARRGSAPGCSASPSTCSDPFHGDLVEALYPAAESLGYDLTLSAVTRAAREPPLSSRCWTTAARHSSSSGHLTASALAALAESQPTSSSPARSERPVCTSYAPTTLLGRAWPWSTCCPSGTRKHRPRGRRPARRAPQNAVPAIAHTMRRAGLDPRHRSRRPDRGSRHRRRATGSPPDATAVPPSTMRARSACCTRVRARPAAESPKTLRSSGTTTPRRRRLDHIHLTTIAQDPGHSPSVALLSASPTCEAPPKSPPARSSPAAAPGCTAQDSRA